MAKITNEILEVTVSVHGAELISVRDAQNGYEYIWQGRNSGEWAWSAPFLFPIIGRLKNNIYTYEGKTYQLPIHGFARDMDFEILAAGDNSIELELTSSPATWLQYPFDFRLRIAYRLEERRLTIFINVVSGEKELYYSIGWHPGFNCPFSPEEPLNDYNIGFQPAQPIKQLIQKGGYLTGEEKVLGIVDSLSLDKKMFTPPYTANIYTNLGPNADLRLRSRNSERSIRLVYSGFDYLTLWREEPDCNYLCIEPIQGVTESCDHTGELIRKQGIQQQEADETARYRIEVEFA